MKRTVLFFILLYSCAGLFAQQSADTASIKERLEVIYKRDQKTRTGEDSADYVRFIDSTNLVYVEALIAQYGWPGKSFLGARGNYIVFLVIQHADLPVQEKYFPLFEESVAKGESRASDLAMLQDRILMRQGKNQIYGSQVVSDDAGGWKFYPIEDEKDVNVRREKVGLPPIEKYAEYFGIQYTLPKQ